MRANAETDVTEDTGVPVEEIQVLHFDLEWVLHWLPARIVAEPAPSREAVSPLAAPVLVPGSKAAILEQQAVAGGDGRVCVRI